MGDATLAGGYRGIKCDGANDPNEMLHLDGEEKIKVNDLIWIDETIGQQDPVNAGGGADARRNLPGEKQSIQNSAPDDRDEVIFEKELTAPPPLQVAAEHPESKHVEQQVQQSAVEKLIGKKLPQIKVLPDEGGHEAEEDKKLRRQKKLQKKDRGVDDQQKLDRRWDHAAAEHHVSGLVLHLIPA